MKQKLIDGKKDAYRSRDLIQLHTIPEIDKVALDQFKLSLDFDQTKKILVQRYGFQSFEKLLDELKKKMMNPVQVGLF